MKFTGTTTFEEFEKYKKKEIKELLEEIRKKEFKIFIGNKLVSKDILDQTFGKNIIHIEIEPYLKLKNILKYLASSIRRLHRHGDIRR